MAYCISKDSISKQTHTHTHKTPMKLPETIDQTNNEDPLLVWASYTLALEDPPYNPYLVTDPGKHGHSTFPSSLL